MRPGATPERDQVTQLKRRAVKAAAQGEIAEAFERLEEGDLDDPRLAKIIEKMGDAMEGEAKEQAMAELPPEVQERLQKKKR